MDTPTDIAQIAHSIQLSLSPVFLLSGIAVLLGVLANRLARAVDRARILEDRHRQAGTPEADDLAHQLRILARRGRLINLAITLGTIAALLVSTVVALLFASAFIRAPLAIIITILFVTAMTSLIGALLAFLIEVRVATVNFRIGPSR